MYKVIEFIAKKSNNLLLNASGRRFTQTQKITKNLEYILISFLLTARR